MERITINVSRVVMKPVISMLSPPVSQTAVHPFEFQGNAPRTDMDISKIGDLPPISVSHFAPYEIHVLILDRSLSSHRTYDRDSLRQRLEFPNRIGRRGSFFHICFLALAMFRW